MQNPESKKPLTSNKFSKMTTAFGANTHFFYFSNPPPIQAHRAPQLV
jgi:hypothetical protein